MTRLVAILNVTPDSFSDGGSYLQPAQAAARIEALIEAGADIIDIGAESTRPGAKAITAAEEWERLEPVISAALAWGADQPISVDTRYAETAKRALDKGVHWINDVSGFADSAMVDAVQPYDCTLVAMHSLAVPPTKQAMLAQDADAVKIVQQWADNLLRQLGERGIARERIILDPGIGFGKSPEQNLDLIRGVEKLRQTGAPWLFGHSRKSFLAQFTSKPAQERDEETLVLSQYLALHKVEYVRVHNVALHKRMLTIMAALSHA